MEFLTSLGRNPPSALPLRGARVSSAAASVSLHPSLVNFVFNPFFFFATLQLFVETDLEFLT